MKNYINIAIISSLLLLSSAIASAGLIYPSGPVDASKLDLLIPDPDLINDSTGNPKYLSTADEATTLTWLKDFLLPLDAATLPDTPVEFINYVKIGNGTSGFGSGVTGFNGLDPNFDWTYAVIRGGGNRNNGGQLSYAIQDTNNDNLLYIDLTSYVGNNGFSHVTFFGKPIENNTVPEPTTLLLFGTGIVGLGAARRRKKKAC